MLHLHVRGPHQAPIRQNSALALIRLPSIRLVLILLLLLLLLLLFMNIVNVFLRKTTNYLIEIQYANLNLTHINSIFEYCQASVIYR